MLLYTFLQALAAVIFSTPDSSASQAPAGASQAASSPAGAAGVAGPTLSSAAAPGMVGAVASNASLGNVTGNVPVAYGTLPGAAASNPQALQAGPAGQQALPAQASLPVQTSAPRPLTFSIQTSERVDRRQGGAAGALPGSSLRLSLTWQCSALPELSLCCPASRRPSLSAFPSADSSVQWFKGRYQHPNTYIQVRVAAAAAAQPADGSRRGRRVSLSSRPSQARLMASGPAIPSCPLPGDRPLTVRPAYPRPALQLPLQVAVEREVARRMTGNASLRQAEPWYSSSPAAVATPPLLLGHSICSPSPPLAAAVLACLRVPQLLYSG